jgi:UDP-arabinose 4-epimerase
VAVVLVPGGAGYIGSFTCRALSRGGHQPITVDDLSTGHRELVQGELVECDIRDTGRLRALMTERGVEAVVHFAACTLARESTLNPGKFYARNVAGHISLLEACRAAGLKAFVFSSSCSIYGAPCYLPLDEEHPRDPVSPYGRTKLIGEWILRDYAAAYGFSYAALRYFNAAGGDREGQLGEWHEPESHLIPLALEAAALGRKLSIFGDRFDTPDGTGIRDYIHVEDLARAHVLALDHQLRGEGSLELNLGTGVGQTVRQVLTAVERVVGRKIATEVVDAHPGDPPQLVADPRRAREALGFACEWTDLDDMVASAWAFHKNLLERRECD